MSTISVLYFVFDPETKSDVSVTESFSSMGVQDFDRNSVDFLIVVADESAISEDFIGETFGQFASKTKLVPVDTADYSQNKLMALSRGQAEIIAFADSDVIYPPDWLRRIDRALSNGDVALAGPPRFKPGSILRTTLLLADFGMLWEDQPLRARYVNLHNFAIRRDKLDALNIEVPSSLYHRFGAPSFLVRALRQHGIRIRLDPAHVVVHGLSWRIWLFEKRLRRYAHAAFMAANDPNATRTLAHGSHPTKPITWLKLWWRWACVYQRRPRMCGERLGLSRIDQYGQRVLLAFLSGWELTIILFFSVFPPFFRRLARRSDWW